MTTDYDERVNDEADEHAQMMNEWRDGWDEKTEFTYSTEIFGYEIKESDNESK